MIVDLQNPPNYKRIMNPIPTERNTQKVILLTPGVINRYSLFRHMCSTVLVSSYWYQFLIIKLFVNCYNLLQVLLQFHPGILPTSPGSGFSDHKMQSQWMKRRHRYKDLAQITILQRHRMTNFPANFSTPAVVNLVLSDDEFSS